MRGQCRSDPNETADGYDDVTSTGNVSQASACCTPVLQPVQRVSELRQSQAAPAAGYKGLYRGTGMRIFENKEHDRLSFYHGIAVY